ncbi:MAG: hypothetical protein QXS02_02930 [Candidatus Thermoplasmatota archaeon]
MACFIVPMSLGVVTTLLRKKIPEGLKIQWLNIMLWGGVLMLAVEHIAHEEIVFYPPFLTAMSNPADTQVMLHEMATIGVAMTLAILAVWLVLVVLTSTLSKRSSRVTKA